MTFTQTTTTARRALPALPPKPVLPAHVRERFDAMNRFERTLNQAMRGGVVAGVEESLRVDLFASLTCPELTDEQRADEARYDREVAAYNAAVDAHNAEVQARRNRREAAQVRAARCNDCFMVHAGECL